MISSIKNLLSSEYNKNHIVAALKRYFLWKCIRFFKLKNVKYSLWDDRKVLLNYDSFQSMWIMYNYIVDWEEFNLIKNFIKPGDTVFDIGSNMGFYTIWLSKFIIPDGKIHSFEPDKENFNRLQKNVSLNKLNGVVKVNNKAVSDKNGLLNFTIGLDGENHISNTSVVTSVQIDAQTLDDYVRENNLTYLNYVKIDVEGFEFSVLKGAEQLLSEKKIGILQLEINKSLSNSGKTPDDILNILKKNNYHLCEYDVTENKLIGANFRASRENYFAVHQIESINKQLI